MTPTLKNIAVRVSTGGDLIACRFDYPLSAGQPFLFSIPESFQGNDWAVLQQVLNGREGKAEVIRGVEGDLAAFKVYDISQYIPKFVRERLGKGRDVPGPNCYQAALVSAGYSELEGRYVDPLEAGFYFSRYFETQRAKPQLGDLRVYCRGHMAPAAAIGFAMPEPAMIDIMEDAHDINPAVGASYVHAFDVEDSVDLGTVFDAVPDISDEGLDALTGITAIAPVAEAEVVEDVPTFAPLIKPGVHAAVVLFGGTVFQRGGWHDDHVNMIVPAAVAMSSIEPIPDDPFYPAGRADDADYASRVISRLSSSALLKRMSGRVVDQKLTASVSKYLLLLDYYSKRMHAVADAKGTFSKNRLNLLTMENVWNILSELEDVLRDGGRGMSRSLLMMRDDVAQEFLRFRSLKWQYNAMMQRYSTLSRTAGRRQKTEYMQDLYREHYVDPDSAAFASEINAHLRMRRIASQKFPAIRACVIERVKKQSTEERLMAYAQSNGSKGINFFRILEEAIASS